MRQLKNEGFSLVEMLIAMAISAIVLAGITALLAYGSRSMSSTQAKVALQDQAKDAINHITGYVMEGTSVTFYEDIIAGDSATRGGILICNKTIESDGTEKYVWYLYWVAGNVESGGSDMLCFIPLADLETETSISLPSDFAEKSDTEQLNYLDTMLQVVEAAENQRRHLLCDDVGKFKCEIRENEDAADSSIKIGKKSLYVQLRLKNESSEFECDKEIIMRNQERR